ncbi:aldo/keto reductase [Microbacterium gorillae]|uniref:aldo/keto reductase n=1 Tax=Microbacterium gorillae TaxID=1231063 RepID=UPI00058D0C4F|nr:aldo/keto reductase [Microbacterium gorillae]
MKHIPLGALSVPNIALGLMRISEMEDAAIRDLVGAARDSGIDFFDHADIYGTALHASERRFAEAMRFSPAERDEITIQTKAGIIPGVGYDFSYDHLVSAVEESLRALNTDRIDVLLLHRPDALMEPDEVARAFDRLYDDGKVRAFGVSNHTPRQMELLGRWIRRPIVANQMQLSVTHAPMIAQGIAANTLTDQATDRDGGVLDYCRLEGVAVQAWSPMGGPGGPFIGDPNRPELNAVLDRLAADYDVTAEAIATAWITRHPANIQVVLGTTRPDRVRASAAGSALPLTRPEWYEIFRAAGHVVP